MDIFSVFLIGKLKIINVIKGYFYVLTVRNLV